MAKDFVLEIGAEEIPARFIPQAMEDLARITSEKLEGARLSPASVKTYATPRRLVVYASGVPERQGDMVREVRGPAARVAFDENGRPTKAAIGFAKSQGVDPSQLVRRATAQGEYVFAVVTGVGLPAGEVLARLVPEIISSMSFPKSMRWGDREFRFVRPIRWILALYGSDVVNLEFEGQTSSRTSYGHRTLGPRTVDVKSAETYVEDLRSAHVIVDPDERRRIIVDQAETLAREAGGRLAMDEELLAEIVNIVEYPTAFLGRFEEEYLKLPKEVIITPMKDHQRYFPVEAADGRLLAVFVGIRNGGRDYLDIVRDGNERVLRARLQDARFFYEEDLKRPLFTRTEELKGIVFQEKLGTVYDKVERVAALVRIVAEEMGLSRPEAEVALKAAWLAKADLVTNMVKEFPELQGIMGRHYAIASGAPEDMAEAVFEHLLPRFFGDEMPKTGAGTALAIADKLDTLAGYFGLGLVPTGSADPFALRRQALGVVTILLEHDLDIDLEKLIDFAIDRYPAEGVFTRSRAEAKAGLVDFFLQRIRGVLLDRGARYDVADAVLSAGALRVPSIMRRAEAVSEVAREEWFGRTVTLYGRVANIVAKAGDAAFELDPDDLAEPAERELYSAYESVRPEVSKVATGASAQGYVTALRALGRLEAPIDTFFTQVMVMAEDPKVRARRLALLRATRDLFLTVADLSKVVVQ